MIIKMPATYKIRDRRAIMYGSNPFIYEYYITEGHLVVEIGWPKIAELINSLPGLVNKQCKYNCGGFLIVYGYCGSSSDNINTFFIYHQHYSSSGLLLSNSLDLNNTSYHQ